MNLLHLVLILEWPILVIALALSSWGLSFIIDQRDNNNSNLYKRYDNQFVAYTKASPHTITSNISPFDIVAESGQTSIRALHPSHDEDTHDSSLHSRIPIFYATPSGANESLRATIQKRNEEPGQSKRRAYWADHSDNYRNVYGYPAGKTGTFLVTFIILISALAVRILLTPIYLLHMRFRSSEQYAQHSWNIVLVSITTIFILLLWASTISSFYFYCDQFSDTISQSIGLIVTIIFCGLACLTSVFSFVLMCMELHKSRRASLHTNAKGAGEVYTKDNLISEASSA